MLEFGRELHNMSLRLRQDDSKDDLNKKMLQDAFSLLAYSNPWNSPVGWQLEPVQRETVCSTLNSAILGMYGICIIVRQLFIRLCRDKQPAPAAPTGSGPGACLRAYPSHVQVRAGFMCLCLRR